MSNAKIIRRLLVLILLLAAGHILLSLNGRGAPLVAKTKLVDRAPGEVERIVVTRAGERPVSLVKKGLWRLESPFPALADERAVLRAIDAVTRDSIRSTHSEGEILKLGRTKGDFGLAAPAATVKVEIPGGADTVRFGKFTPVRDGVFAAVDGDSRVYVVGTNVLAALAVPAEAFRETALVPSGTGGVDAFDVKRGKGALLRFRLKDGVWTGAGVKDGVGAEQVSVPRIREFLSSLGDARAISSVWPVGDAGEPDMATTAMLASYGLDAESAVAVTLHGGGPDRQVVFGKAAEGGAVYALVQDGGAIVTADGPLADFAAKGNFADTRLFPLEERDVTRISLADGQVNCLLAKDSSGSWRLDAPVAAAADPASAAKLVAKILELRPEDRSETGIVVTLSTNIPSETVSREAVLSVLPSMALADVRSREIISVDRSDVKRIAVFAAGSGKPDAVVFDKDLREWTVESSGRSGTVASSSIEDVLDALCPLKAERVVKLKMSPDEFASYGLDSPRWTIAVDTFQKGSLRRNILVGRNFGNGRFATLGASDAVFVLSDETVKKLTSPILAE